jgi:hypothetical protein
MNISHKSKRPLTALFGGLGALTLTSSFAQQLPTTDAIDTRSGKPESNWIKTLPGKGWFTYFRLYGPTQPYFDRSWVLPDIKLMK